MNPLAFNIDGEAFELPPTAAGWRVKRLRAGKGAPELVYNSDGLPLVVPLETDMDELRRIVGVSGKYRLDPVDEEHRVLKGADTAYVLVRSAEPMPLTAEPAVTDSGPNTNAVLMEAMRQNSELARSIVERFPSMLEASANLIRAADGAGMPARKPRHEVADDYDDATDDDEDDGDGDGRAAPSAAGFDLNALIAQLVPVLITSIASGDIKFPSFAEMLDWRRAARKPSNDGDARKPGSSGRKPGSSAGKPPTSQAGPASGEPAASAEPDGANVADTAEAAGSGIPPLSPQAMVHFLAILAALTPEEATLARAAAGELSPSDKRSWFEQLSAMSVPEAVTRIRELLAPKKTEAA